MSFFRRPTDDSSEDDESIDESLPSDSLSDNNGVASVNHESSAIHTEEYSDTEDGDEGLVSELQDMGNSSLFQVPSINTISNTIRKSTRLSISNRLHSINSDSIFVQSAAAALSLPIIANERCGSWYVPPTQKAGSCYFKSTDGHFGCWSFSLRRLNLGILELIGSNGGGIIVDSTRRGKVMPDALSKTVPIWCAVMNEVLFPDHKVQVDFHPNSVSPSEVAQIRKLLPGFVASLQDLNLEITKLSNLLKKPMKPFYLTRDTDLTEVEYEEREYNSVYLLSASRYLKDELQPRDFTVLGGNYVYVQGAGDDHEGWARGLTPIIYWENRDQLLRTPEADLPNTIDSIVEGHAQNERGKDGIGPSGLSILRKVDGRIGICDQATYESLGNLKTGDAYSIVCSKTSTNGEILEEYGEASEREFITFIPPNKVGSKLLRTKLPTIVDWAELKLRSTEGRLIIVCHTGNDVAVGIALAVVCQLFDESGRFVSKIDTKQQVIDKNVIRQRLSWIISDRTQANPSRATLQAVNTFLMGWT